MVTCTRIDGTSVHCEEAVLDDGFDFCPSLSRAGYPLMLKREPMGTAGVGASSAHDARELLAIKMLIYRLMSARGGGLSPLWQCGDGRMPTLLAALADGGPFYPHEWRRLRHFYEEYSPMPVQLQAVDVTPSPNACRTEEEFETKLKEWAAPKAVQPGQTHARRQRLCDRFPLGSRVEAQDLKKTDLNSLVGLVTKYDEVAQRVGVDFPPPHGLLALRPKNLLMLPALAITDTSARRLDNEEADSRGIDAF